MKRERGKTVKGKKMKEVLAIKRKVIMKGVYRKGVELLQEEKGTE